MTFDLNLRVLKGVVEASSDEETRFYLQGVLLEIRKAHVTYVATNGHIVLAHREPIKDTESVGDFIFPKSAIGTIKLGKLGADVVEAMLQPDGTITVPMSGGTTMSVRPVDGTFPAWHRVLPSVHAEKDVRLGAYDGALLVKLDKGASTIKGTKADQPSYSRASVDGPAMLSWSGLPRTVGVVMPYRQGEGKIPEFIRVSAG